MEALAVDGAEDGPGGDPLQGVAHRQRRQHRRVLGQAIEHAIDQRRRDQGPHAVVDQHQLGRGGAQALEPEAHRFLPGRSALGRLEQVEAEAAAS